MAIRYSVQNPDGEDYASPLDQQGFKLQDMMLQHVLGQMNSGNGTGYGGNQMPGGGAMPMPGGGADGPSLADQLEARKALMRESVAGDLARGAQTGDYGIRNTELQQGGATDRARIGIEPQMGEVALRNKQYTDIEPATVADATARAARSGMVTDALRGAQARTNMPDGGDWASKAMMMAAIGGHPSDLVDPRELAKQQALQGVLGGVASNDPSQVGAFANWLQTGDLKGFNFQGRLDQGTMREVEMANNIPEVQAVRQIIAKKINDRTIGFTGGEQQAIKNAFLSANVALDQLHASPQAKAIISGQLRTALDQALQNVSGFEPFGADNLRGQVGVNGYGG